MRYRERARVLVGDAFDVSDPDEILRQVIKVSVPLFQKPEARPNRSTVHPGVGHGLHDAPVQQRKQRKGRQAGESHTGH